jgi:putative ABC transport system permease protein
MRLFDRIAPMARALFRSRRVDVDLADEMQFHIEREAEANISRGMAPDEARRAARLSFGTVDASLEASREERPGAAVRQFLRDVRLGGRLLAKSPVFAATAIAIVAIGVGAATAIFSVVHGVMLRPLPFHEPDRLVTIWLSRGEARMFPSAADAAELRALPGVFTDIALIRSSNANLSLVGNGAPRRLEAARISPNLLGVLGVRPSLGRGFASNEDQLGRDQVVLISDGLWRSHFASDPGVIGRQIRLNGVVNTVIGVMPPEFQYPRPGLDAWITAVLEPGELQRTALNNYRLVARLDPDISLDRARREAIGLATRLGREYHPMTWENGPAYSVDAMLDDTVRPVRATLQLLLGAVTFVLLIACVNLSNLFGARATARSSEFAVRLALGASQARLIAQAVAESLPALVVGGLLGISAARAAIAAFIASAPAGLPRLDSIAVNGPVLAYSLTVVLLAGIAASVLPALQARKSDFTSVTRENGRASTTGRGRSRARRAGVALQVAFALPLLVGASTLIQSAIAVGRIDLGFSARQVATVAFDVFCCKYQTVESQADYYARVVEASRAVPGIELAAITNRIPLGNGQTYQVTYENPTGATPAESEIDSRTVTPDYFATLGIPLLAGRTFTDLDDADAPPVVIVDERIANSIWPGESPIGKRLRRAGGPIFTIVGVVGHVRASRVESDPRPQVYWSMKQWVQSRAVLAVRTTLPARTLFPSIVDAIHSVDPEQAVYDLRTMDTIIDRSLAQRRITTTLMVAFGVISLVLAAVGIYGVVAFGVSQRMREFGIRLALGATSGTVTRLVVRQGMSMAVAGSVAGLLLALATAGLLANMVFGVSPMNATSFAVSMGILLLVTGTASYLPARRAAAADPSVTLRSE